MDCSSRPSANNFPGGKTAGWRLQAEQNFTDEGEEPSLEQY